MSLLLSARKVIVCGCLALAVSPLMGQTNSYQANGLEYAIAGSLPGDQVRPAISVNTSGGYVVWHDNLTDGEGLGVSARRLGSSLSGSLSAFRVNARGSGDQEQPRVALLNDGGAVFVWQGGRRSYQHIYARFMSAAGTWLTSGDDVPVNTFTNNFQINPALAVLANGNVVVTWSSYNQFSANSLQDVYAQVMSPTGQKVGGELLLNQFTSYNQRTPSVAALGDGRFVVAWVSEQQRRDMSVDVYARILNADGSSAGGEIAVNTATNVCANPTVVALPQGGFIVGWSEKDLRSLRTNSWDVCARAFAATGLPAGSVARLNQYRLGDQFMPLLTLIGSDVLAVWTSLGQDGSAEGIRGRFLRNDLTAQGNEFSVNTTTIGSQIHPAVAADGLGTFLVAWSSFRSVASGFDLCAQRYSSALAPLPAPDPPFVTVLNSSSLAVSWPPLAGYNVAEYRVYADGAVTPSAVVTNTWWTMAGLAPSSTHRFQYDYVLADGRTSPVSGANSNTTYGTLNWDGIPNEWMVYYYGTNIRLWPFFDEDSDRDGVSTLNEFLAGTCPTNAASVLRTHYRPGNHGMFLEWNTEPGLIYQVQVSTNLTYWRNFAGMRFAAGTVDSVYVGGSPASYCRVLRVR